MSDRSPLVWSEGMFMRPQHLQQLVRYLEHVIDFRVRAAGGSLWGISSLQLDENMLMTGRLSVTACKAVLPDGTVINVPEDDNPPPPIEIPADTVSARAYLCLPIRMAGFSEFTRDEATERYARYLITSAEVADNTAAGGAPVPLEVGKPRLRLMLEHEDRNRMSSIPIARVVEVRADRSVVLEEDFMPSSTDIQAVPRLAGFLNEFVELLHNRGENLVGRLGSGGQSGVADVADFMLLQLVNRLEYRYRHIASIRGVHPSDLYGGLAETAAELATFTSESRRQVQFPPYRHDDLNSCFPPVIHALRLALSAVLEQTAIALPLQDSKFGVRISPIGDRDLIRSARFVLMVSASLSPNDLRQRFAAEVKIGPVEKIRQLITLHLPGIMLNPLAVAPRQLPYHAGFLYFQLDPGSLLWREMEKSGGFAFHFGGEFPDLQVEFWAIRKK